MSLESLPTVRVASLDDLPSLARIYDHYAAQSDATFDTGPSPDGRRAWFSSYSPEGPYRALVADQGGRITGYATSSRYRAHPAFDQTVEFSVYLDLSARRQGTGSRLYETLIDHVRSCGMHVALAGIALPNDASVALHRKFGFREVGVFDEYAMKNGRFVSSVWMQLIL